MLNLFLVDMYHHLSEINQPITWIQDYQEKYLPHFFNKKELRKRLYRDKIIIKSQCDIVFSSDNAKNDFEKFYPGNANKKHILKFLSIIELSQLFRVSETKIRNKYGLNKSYLIVSNQFWAHKNHIVVLKALKILKKINPDTLIVFTGKEYDYRNTTYVNDIKKFVHENNLNDNVRFLGLIDRMEQLALMRFSISVIQPSLFEGWSTVVEDCKTIGKHLFLSDLPVHQEQITKNVTFFDPSDEIKLAGLLSTAEDKNYDIYTEKELIENLENRIVNFAHSFLSIFN